MHYIRAFYDIQKRSIASAFVNISPSTPTRELPQRKLFFVYEARITLLLIRLVYSLQHEQSQG